MANRVFELQSSRFMIVLQLLIFIFLAVLLYHVLPLGIWLLCLGIMAIVWFRFLQQPQVRRFEHLHGQDWSFEFVNSDLPVQRWQIVKMIDHHCYIVLYFSSSQNDHYTFKESINRCTKRSKLRQRFCIVTCSK